MVINLFSKKSFTMCCQAFALISILLEQEDELGLKHMFQKNLLVWRPKYLNIII